MGCFVKSIRILLIYSTLSSYSFIVYHNNYSEKNFRVVQFSQILLGDLYRFVGLIFADTGNDAGIHRTFVLISLV